MSYPCTILDGLKFYNVAALEVPAGCALGQWYGGMDHRYTGDGAGTIRLFPFAKKFTGDGVATAAEPYPSEGYSIPAECRSAVARLLAKLEGGAL
jgi:hypothetical protein